MIKIKSEKEIELMRSAGKLTAAARALAGSLLKPGITTGEIDRELKKFITSNGGYPTFLHYNDYPKCSCISINDEVIHGIPGRREIRDGDIVSVDIGATLNGYVGDCAATYAVGTVTDEDEKLIRVTRQSFFEGIRFARAGNRISDISRAIQNYVESNGFSVVREYVGHGIGANMHEDPEVPNYVTPRQGPRLYPGMTLAIEPMVNAGVYGVKVLSDGWTVKTADGKRSAHYENTILITNGDPEILTINESM